MSIGLFQKTTHLNSQKMISLSLPVLYPYVYIQPLSSKSVKPSPPHPYPDPSNTQKFTLHFFPGGVWPISCVQSPHRIQSFLPLHGLQKVSNTKTHRDSLQIFKYRVLTSTVCTFGQGGHNNSSPTLFLFNTTILESNSVSSLQNCFKYPVLSIHISEKLHMRGATIVTLEHSIIASLPIWISIVWRTIFLTEDLE